MPRYHASIYARNIGALGIFEWRTVDFTTQEVPGDLIQQVIETAHREGYEVHHVRKVIEVLPDPADTPS